MTLPRNSVGLGLRSRHCRQILAELPEVPWFEILLDNHTAEGGLIPHQLTAIREHYPLSFHSVALSLGGVDPLDRHYLAMIKRMIGEYQPAQISDHVCFTQYSDCHFNDLLPIPYTEESLRHVSRRIDQVQDYLGRQLLIENVSTYLQFQSSEMNEAEFISELVVRTGCAILLDINNAYVNEFNHGYSAKEYISTIPMASVAEVHLAGFEDKESYLVDAHNNRVSKPVWELFDYYLQFNCSAPVMIEWDNDIPELAILLEESRKAEAMQMEHGDNHRARITC